jgi:hypothetical protein
LFSSSGAMSAEASIAGATWLISAIVLGCLLYTQNRHRRAITRSSMLLYASLPS